MLSTEQIRLHVTAAVVALALVLAGSAQASTVRAHHAHPASHATRHRTAQHHATRHAGVRHASTRHTRHRRSVRRHTASLGQRTIDPQRATEIQQALIQAHYLNGSPTGQWDSGTQAAMEKYQTDNGWQAKITPDSRALIKLGLGPKQDEGEYSANSSGVSKLTTGTPSDALRTMATSEMPAIAEN